MEMEQPMKIYCRNSNVCAAVRGDQVIMVHPDPSDKTQHWIQAYDVGGLTDKHRRRAFALVNRATRQAIVNTDEPAQLELAFYSSVAVDLSMLWSMGKMVDGFSSVRVLTNIHHTLNALKGNAREGTILGTYPKEDGDNAMWKIDPINDD